MDKATINLIVDVLKLPAFVATCYAVAKLKSWWASRDAIARKPGVTESERQR
jgi:hypothetical protein